MNNRNILIGNLNCYFSGFWKMKNIDIDNDFKSVPTNKFNACMSYIYECYVNSLEIKNNKGFKQYSYIDFSVLVNWYISKTLDYDFISIYGFTLLINRSMVWLYNLRNNPDSIINAFIIDVNNIEFFNSDLKKSSNNINNLNRETDETSVENARTLLIDTIEKLYINYQQAAVSKLNDNSVGLIANANNNKDMGLLYAKERIQETAKARAMIKLSELPKLDDI